MKRVYLIVAAFLLLATVATVLWRVHFQAGEGSLVALAIPSQPPRTSATIERLKRHLRHPETLVVLTVVNPDTEHAAVEIEFQAQGRRGLGRSRFWVLWTERGPEDGLPEHTDGSRDDPHGLFKE